MRVNTRILGKKEKKTKKKKKNPLVWFDKRPIDGPGPINLLYLFYLFYFIFDNNSFALSKA